MGRERPGAIIHQASADSSTPAPANARARVIFSLPLSISKYRRVPQLIAAPEFGSAEASPGLPARGRSSRRRRRPGFEAAARPPVVGAFGNAPTPLMRTPLECGRFTNRPYGTLAALARG